MKVKILSYKLKFGCTTTATIEFADVTEDDIRKLEKLKYCPFEIEFLIDKSEEIYGKV